MNTPFTLIETRTTRYTGEDGKERAVLFHEDYEQLLATADLFRAFQRLIDYEAYGVKICFNECTREGHKGNDTQKDYQSQYNQLVFMREKMISPEWVLQFLDGEKFDMPEATERIFINNEPKNCSHS